ncbi:MAG: ECF-type sigma factor [Phycisphaerales bacterium]|nr:ECF-type sigma factor [Phycisphaerales bacterium]
MNAASQTTVTTLLRAAASGDRKAASDLLPELYGELRKLARARMNDLAAGQTLQPTALVHEAYMRLVGREGDGFENRRHFFFAAARAMEDILVEQARRKSALKRGGDREKTPLDDELLALQPVSTDIPGLSTALRRLETTDAAKADLVRLRFFAGLTMDEAAAILDIPVRTAERHWRFTRALLQTWMGDTAA